MAIKISLNQVIDSLESCSDGIDLYLHGKTGEIRMVTEDDRFLLDEDVSVEDLPKWQREHLPLVREVFESENWLQLPDKSDIHDWSIMESFCRVQCDEVRDELMDSIHGRGAFRLFRRTVDRFGLRDAWFEFRREEFKRIACEWLESRDLQYE